jgi:hypothetical protein
VFARARTDIYDIRGATADCAKNPMETIVMSDSIARRTFTLGQLPEHPVQHGADNVAVVLQGKLIGDTIEEAGLSAMPKTVRQEDGANG